MIKYDSRYSDRPDGWTHKPAPTHLDAPEPDPLDGHSTRALLATAAALFVALVIIAVLPW